MPSYDQIAAIILTRGDVPLDEIIPTLPYGEIIVASKADKGDKDRGLVNRYLAFEETDRPFLYLQDDDIVFTNHAQLCEAHGDRTDVFTSNMPSPWWDQMYADKQIALTGAGCIMPRALPWDAFKFYLAHYEWDDLFEIYCDLVMGGLTPYQRVDFGYRILPVASAPGRIWTTEGQVERKAEIVRRIYRLREIRNGK